MGELSGKVTGCATPPPHKLAFLVGEEVVFEITTDEDGAFAVDLPAGSYHVACDGRAFCTPRSVVVLPHGHVSHNLVCEEEGCCSCKS